MFTEKRLMFIYCVSPVHMGSGTALGVIDNPIQRERHTGHPVLAGSGLKGAFRAAASAAWGRAQVDALFGPERDASDHAGAVSFADGQLVAFPVRSLKGGYVYATAPYALSRLGRLAEAAGVDRGDLSVPEVKETQAGIANPELKSGDRIVLEAYAFSDAGAGAGPRSAGTWLAARALPEGNGHDFFRRKLETDLVLLHDGQLSFFARNATAVEPHVRINDESGTADDGGLFFTENVPPEALFATLLMASGERRRKGDGGRGMDASEIVERLVAEFDGKAMQIGGDATTGRGQVVVRFAGGVK